MLFPRVGIVTVAAGLLLSAPLAAKSRSELRPRKVDLRAAALLISGQTGGGLNLRAEAWRFFVDRGNLLVAVEIGNQPALSDFGSSLDLYLYSLTDDDHVSASAGYGLDLVDQPPTDLWTLVVPFEPNEGSRLRLLVRVGSQFLVRDLAMPAADDPTNGLLLVEETGGSRLASVGEHPFRESPWLPSPETRLQAGDSGIVLFSDADQPERDCCWLTPIDAATSESESLLLDLEAHPTSDESPQLSAFSFEVPAVSAGEYLFSKKPSAAQRPGRHRLGLTVELLEAEGAVQIAQPKIETAPQQGRQQILIDRLVHRLEQILVAAESDSAEAVARLTELRAEYVASYDVFGYSLLETAENLMVSKIAEVDRQALLPILLWQLESVHRHRRAEQAGLTGHSARVLSQTALTYAVDGTNQQHSADVLTVLGSTLIGAGSLSHGSKYLEIALQVEPDHQLGLLLSAIFWTKQGRPELSRAHLRHLLELQPDHAEALLRTAIDDVNQGRPDRALRGFQQVIEGRAEDWIELVAAQETSRLLIAHNELRSGSVTEEIGRLRQRWPHDQQLAILFDFASTMTSTQLTNTTSGEQLTASVEALAATETSLSPRSRYNTWPGVPSETMISLEQLAATHQPGLQRALGVDR